MQMGTAATRSRSAARATRLETSQRLGSFEAVASAQPVPELSQLQTEVIELFVRLSQVLGQPRSLAEIYGLLFISARPLTMEQLIQGVGLSKGSTSQGLRYLRNIGAVTTVYVPGDRRVHYQAVAELKNLLVRFLRDQFVPHLVSGNEQLGKIARLVKSLPDEERTRLQSRVAMLQSWGKRAKLFVPMLVKMMGD